MLTAASCRSTSGRCSRWRGASRKPSRTSSAPDGADATPEWRAYVHATLAFLRRDAAALGRARQAYAAIAPGSMRLRIIDGLLACPAEPYAKATHCRM
jgi:hypothetical protein